VLRVENIWKSFSGVPVLRDVSLDVRAGDLAAAAREFGIFVQTSSPADRGSSALVAAAGVLISMFLTFSATSGVVYEGLDRGRDGWGRQFVRLPRRRTCPGPE
jgi:hypothetical protein